MLKTDKAIGAMMGLAVGDALGAPVEGMKGPHIRQVFDGPVEDYVDALPAWERKPHRWRLPGLHTDDTQQALMLADTLAENGDWDAAEMARLFIRFADPTDDLPCGVHRGAGANFRHCVEQMKNGTPPLLCGAPSAGPGAAMRIAPVGLWFAEDEDLLVERAIESALMTHHDVRGILAAVAVAVTVAELAKRDDTGAGIGPEVAQHVCDVVDRSQEVLDSLCRREGVRLAPSRPWSEALRALPGLLSEGNDQLAEQTILSEAARHNPDHPIRSLNQPFAPACVPGAIYRALSCPSPMEGLIATINEGFDCDTVGAIVGAMVGARFGELDIPEEWRRGLLGGDLIIQRGEAMALREMDYARWIHLYEAEREWSLREWTERQALMDRLKEEQRKRDQKLRARGKTPPSEKKRERQKKERLKAERMADDEFDDLDEASPSDKKQLRREREKRKKEKDRERSDRRRQSRRSAFMSKGELGLREFDDDDDE